MLVVIHDFAPVFLRELNIIVEALQPALGSRMSVAVVPRWHGVPNPTATSRFANGGFRDLMASVEERLLHGWTHQSQHRFRPVSLLTGQADEFRGLAESVIQERLRTARAEFAELTGEQAHGLVPPAWQLPIRSTELASFRFVMRFRSLECCQDPHRVRSLVTWSWDWGRLGWLSRGGELIGGVLRRCDSAAIPCIALHPADVRRGDLPRAVRRIRQLIDSGHEPTTATRLMSESGTMSIGELP